MLYIFFTSIVFLAELVLTVTIIRALFKFDKALLYFDETLNEAKSSIKDIAVLGNKMSGQLVELAEEYTYKIEKERDDYTLRLLNKLLISLLLFKFGSKNLKKIIKSKFAKRMGMGLKLIANMV